MKIINKKKTFSKTKLHWVKSHIEKVLKSCSMNEKKVTAGKENYKSS